MANSGGDARLRVTVIGHELRGFTPSGGMGTATTFLALALARMGHAVEVVTGENEPASIDPHWAEAYDRAGIRLRAAPEVPERVEPWPFANARRTELALAEEPPDVVVAHDFGAPVYTALRAREAGLGFERTLFVVFCHGTRRYALDLSPNLAPRDLQHVLRSGVLEQATIALADVAVSPSAFLVEWMRREGWRLPEQTAVIPYVSRSVATGEPVRTRRDDAGAPLRRLAFFGRLDERKGLRLFAAGLNALDARLLEPLELEFVGRTTATWPRERVEALLSERTRRALRRVTFETQLDQHEALERLSRSGTLVVMPSLQETFSNTVYECLELGIPFRASAVGGVPELVAPDDRDRVLFEPTAAGVEGALRAVLAKGRVPPPAKLAFAPDDSFERWAEIVALRPKTPKRDLEAEVDVVVVQRTPDAAVSRCVAAIESQTKAAAQIIVVSAERTTVEAAWRAGLDRVRAPFVAVLDADDVPDNSLLQTLARALESSDADAVTCGVRVTDGGETLHFFEGEPGSLGLLANGYGRVALVRRSALGEVALPWPPDEDPDWPLLARVAASGARIVSVPAPLVTRREGAGTVTDTPSDALLAVQELEAAMPRSLRGAARLAAGLAADAPRRGSETTTRSRLAIGLLALTLLGGAIRFSTLGRQSYWYDELVTVSVLHRSFGEMLRAVPRSEATPYVYYVLAWPWTRVFGFGETALRSLAALAGTLTIPVTYAAGTALVSRRVGLVAAALVAVNPFLVWYSQEARAYAWFAFFAAGTLVFFARALHGQRRGLGGWSITAALAVATHYFAVFVVGIEAVWLLVRRGRGAALAVAVPVVVLLAELPLLLDQRGNGGNLSQTSLVHRVAGIPKDLVVGYSFPAELVGSAAGLLLVATGCALALRTRKEGAVVAGAVAAFTLVAPVVLAVAGADYVIARNMIAAIVPAAVFAGAGFASTRVGLVAGSVLCALSLSIVGAVASDLQYGRTDWRGAARALGDTSRTRAIVVTPTIDSTLWSHYLPTLSPAAETARVGEIDVIGLATQGGFSAGAVHPPTAAPRPAPDGFRIVSTKRTSTYVLVRYRGATSESVARSELAALALSPVAAAILLQGPTSGAPR